MAKWYGSQQCDWVWREKNWKRYIGGDESKWPGHWHVVPARRSIRGGHVQHACQPLKLETNEESTYNFSNHTDRIGRDRAALRDWSQLTRVKTENSSLVSITSVP